MNFIKKFRGKSPEEKNKSYINIILCCTFLAVLLLFTILAITFPETRGIGAADIDGTGAQSAASEISAGLQVKSEDSLSSALSYVETYYSSTPSDKRSDLVSKRFTKDFFSYLKSEAGIRANAAEQVDPGDDAVRRIEITSENDKSSDSSADKDSQQASNLETFEKYLENFADDDLGVSINPADGGLYIAYSKEDNYVEIQNITIKSEKDGSEIVTDIRFTPPADAAGSDSGTYRGSINSYAVAADGSIISSGGSNHIDGAAYAGSSIAAQTSGSLTLDGPETVTRGDIDVSGAALLNITDGEVWADNVNTKSSAGSVVTSHAGNNIQASADFFLSGNLSLTNNGYDVDINGNYYGYGTGRYDSSPSGSSSESSSGASGSGSGSSVSLTGSAPALLQKLFNTNRILTSTDGDSTTYSAAGTAGSRLSKITIAASAAQAHVAYKPGQTLWIASGSVYNVAGVDGRTPFTSAFLPASASASSDDDSGATNLDMLYTYQYNGLTSGFDKNFSTSRPSYELVDHVLRESGTDSRNVIFVPDGKGGYDEHSLKVFGSGDDAHVNITPRSEYKNGIVVADCDVNITNVNFDGMILTTGDVNMMGGATVTASPEIRFTALTEASGSDDILDSGRVKVELDESSSK